VPVIINEIEVVVDSEEPRAHDATDSPAPVPRLRPEDVSDIVERQTRALMRVVAH
jgi:hypothetical protein